MPVLRQRAIPPMSLSSDEPFLLRAIPPASQSSAPESHPSDESVLRAREPSLLRVSPPRPRVVPPTSQSAAPESQSSASESYRSKQTSPPPKLGQVLLQSQSSDKPVLPAPTSPSSSAIRQACPFLR
ncbi:hypothetical protein BJ508DRAFT_315643 [Ascobolus immersus RN42]|uniref:Uncharacterized protein n=1 Tax=Ascobolus immersus RN42 TaxID=1160509 RepID=A0A3N4H9Z6_ASCIM|nr:hypothetical protein BJ508DRAFT_315643 [Ascobolus immersus RN42]